MAFQYYHFASLTIFHILLILKEIRLHKKHGWINWRNKTMTIYTILLHLLFKPFCTCDKSVCYCVKHILSTGKDILGILLCCFHQVIRTNMILCAELRKIFFGPFIAFLKTFSLYSIYITSAGLLSYRISF